MHMKRGLIQFILFLVLVSFSQSAIVAYQPGKWDWMDTYILKGDKNGPSGVVFKNAKGEILESSTFEYDGNGRLISELFYTEAGKYKGRLDYVYDGTNLTMEILKDPGGKILSKKSISYRNGMPDQVRVTGENGAVLIEQRYNTKNNSIVSGKEINGDITDRFSIEYKMGKPVKFKVLNKNGAPLSEIHYIYDNQGRLIKRELTVEDQKSSCVYNYGPNGKLISFTYFNESNGKILQDSTIEIVYKGEKKNNSTASMN